MTPSEKIQKVVERVRVLDEKATKGPWVIWDGCSWRRIGSESTDNLVCEPMKQNDGHPDLLFRNGGSTGPDARMLTESRTLLPKLARALERAVLAIWREDPNDVEGYLQEIAEILEGE